MTLVHTDNRGRLSLGKILQADRDYRITTSPHGTVTFEPVTINVVSDYEAAVLDRPGLADALDQALATVDRGGLTPSRRRTREGS